MRPMAGPTCPVCGSPDAREIVYGFLVEPPPDDLATGGCVVGPDNPTHECRGSTRHRFIATWELDRQVELLERWSDEVDGAALGEGAFAPGPALWVGTREIAHFHDGHALEVRLTRAVIRQRRDDLRGADHVTLRKATSDWIEVDVATDEGLALGADLVRAAVAANLPTAPPGVPPTGADLARRRRFH